MPLSTARLAILATAVCLAVGGCATSNGPQEQPLLTPVPLRTPPASPASAHSGVVPAAYREEPASPQVPLPPAPTPQPFDGRTSLTPEDLVRVVLERNPTLDQMRAVAAATAARYPQTTSLDDPTLGFTTAPGSAWSPNAGYAARVEVSQKFLYPGKRTLKGTNALAETTAAAEDVEDARLQLIESARSALADYFLAIKATEVAGENLKLLRALHQNAETRYNNLQGQQQDVLQATVELARQEERLVSLRRGRQVAIARLNTLMHLPPDGQLPPPAAIDVADPLPDVGGLRELARGRPDVRAAVARVAAEEASLALAMKQYKPDVEMMAAYDGFWQGASGRPLQWQLGARVNVPLRYGRRDAAVDEARANVARRRAELARLTDQVNFQVQEAFEQVRESDEIVGLYKTKILKAVEANVKEAQSAYANNKVPFLNLIEAQRNWATVRDRYNEALAESARRRAALERAVGKVVP